MTDKTPAMPELPEPEAYMFQYEEAVHTMFVCRQQVEWGFEQNNPQLKKVGEAFTADQMRARDAMWAERIAALQSAQPAAEPDEDAILSAGHRLAWRYKHSSDPEHSSTYTFNRACLLQFARAILALRPQAESAARKAAQEQLYTERERHTAEVKRLQAEIGRLQALRPQAVPMTPEPVAYFSYGEDSGYLEHATADAANKHANEEITAYRGDAMHDNEWPSEVDSVCWGVVLQKATAVDNSEEAGQDSFDYELAPHHGITAQGGEGGEAK